MATLHSDVVTTLKYMAEIFTPRVAFKSNVGFLGYNDEFMAKIIPQIMEQAGVKPDASLWQDEFTLDALSHVLEQKCREDIEFGAKDVVIECVDDDDIYDGYGGYKHNSDDGSEMDESEEEAN